MPPSNESLPRGSTLLFPLKLTVTETSLLLHTLWLADIKINIKMFSIHLQLHLYNSIFWQQTGKKKKDQKNVNLNIWAMYGPYIYDIVNILNLFVYCTL